MTYCSSQYGVTLAVVYGVFVANRTEYQERADKNYEEKRKKMPKVSSFNISQEDMQMLNEMTEFHGETRKAFFVRAIKQLYGELIREKKINKP
jgi:hypothetical protein